MWNRSGVKLLKVSCFIALIMISAVEDSTAVMAYVPTSDALHIKPQQCVEDAIPQLLI